MATTAPARAKRRRCRSRTPVRRPTARHERREPQASRAATGSGRSRRITRAIIKTGSLTVESDDVAATRQKAITAIAGLDGQVASEDTGSDADGKITQANLVLKVPTKSYETAIQRLSDLGKRLQIHQESSDVTEQVVDVASRIESQRASLDRMRALMAKANTVGEIVSVESELTRREADLESLLAKQKNLALQTDLATLTLTVTEKGQPPVAGRGPGPRFPRRSEGWLERVHRHLLRAGDRVRCGPPVPRCCSR